VSFEYHEPTSLAEAVDLGARFGADGRFLAGGTDLIIQMRRRKISPGHIVSLHRVPGLDVIEANGTIRIGALVTHRALERHSRFRGKLQALVESAEVVGGHQVRNTGTVGGNVVNASPAADVVPVLLALDAMVTCVGPDGERTLPLDDFLVSAGRTTRRVDEVLTAVSFADMGPHSATSFLKAGRRKAMEIAVVCVAAQLTLDPDRERCLRARIALGAVAPRTWRARDAERSLENVVLTPGALREASRLAAVGCQPISDVRASGRYRRLLVEIMAYRALLRCLRRVRGETP
jgi:carbon-monoxide dehydrogenase medium subunit